MLCVSSCVSMSWSHLCICVYIDVLRGSSCIACCMHAARFHSNALSLHAHCIVCVHAAMTVRSFLYAIFHCGLFAVRSLVHAHRSRCVISSLRISVSILLRVLRVSLSCGVFDMHVYLGIAVFSMRVRSAFYVACGIY